LPGEAHASVAIVFREGPESIEVLLIERAEREGDPWSGHMAFPGGRLEDHDDSSRSTARRETFEEVGIELASAEYLGRLDDIEGNPRASATLVVAGKCRPPSGFPWPTCSRKPEASNMRWPIGPTRDTRASWLESRTDMSSGD